MCFVTPFPLPQNKILLYFLFLIIEMNFTGVLGSVLNTSDFNLKNRYILCIVSVLKNIFNYNVVINNREQHYKYLVF